MRVEKNTLFLPLVALSITILSSCASYKVKTVQTAKTQDYANNASVQHLNIALDVLDTKEKNKQIFETKPMYQEGYLPIMFLFKNDGTSNYKLIAPLNSIVAIDESGNSISPTPAEAVVESAKRNMGGWVFLSGIMGAVSAHQANKKMQQDFLAKQLKEGLIYPHTNQTGFLWFQTANRLEKIVINQIEDSSGTALASVSIPLKYQHPKMGK